MREVVPFLISCHILCGPMKEKVSQTIMDTSSSLFVFEQSDEVLRHHLQSAPRNAMYTSNTIQNELINITGSCMAAWNRFATMSISDMGK